MRISVWYCLLQQTVCTGAILCACGEWMGLPRLSLPRLLLCAALGGVGSVWGLMSQRGLRMALLFASLLLPCLGWPGLQLGTFVRMAPVQLLLALLFSGFVGLGMQWLPVLPALTLGVVLIHRLPRWQKRQPAVQHAWLTIRCGDRTLRCMALVDSGNLLYDDVTDLPVIVLSRSAAARLLDLPQGESWLPGMRYLYMRTAAGKARLAVFRADEIRLTMGNHTDYIQAVLGISPDEHAHFSALVPAGVMRSEARQMKEDVWYEHDV